jgi:hypothetical protein
MPILSAKENPPSKPFECSILEKKGTWWIAKTMPRQEKSFAFDLLEQGIDYYLPFYQKKTMRSDGKIRKSSLILFPSYVPFVNERPFDLLKQKNIVTILPIKSQLRFISQLSQIDLSLNAQMDILPSEPNEWNSGDSVKISSGPLTGVVGRVIYIKNRTNLLLKVESLGTVRVQIDLTKVKIEKISTKSPVLLYN